jgi:hypothetical protein
MSLSSQLSSLLSYHARVVRAEEARSEERRDLRRKLDIKLRLFRNALRAIEAREKRSQDK